MIPLIVKLFIQELQLKYAIHVRVRTLSPVKRRRKVLHQYFYTNIKAFCRNHFLPPHTFSCHASLHPFFSPMKRTMNMPRRNNRNMLEPIFEKVLAVDSSCIYSHHLPWGIPIESESHKFQIKPPNSSLQRSQKRVHPVCVWIPPAIWHSAHWDTTFQFINLSQEINSS